MSPTLPALSDSVEDTLAPGVARLSVLVLSGDFFRVHYALVLASSAAALGRPVTLFFTNHALNALRAEAAAGGPGWWALDAPGGAAAANAELQARRLATFEELLLACAEMGVRFIACEMGLRVIDSAPSVLRADLPVEVAGAVTFLADAAAGGAMLAL